MAEPHATQEAEEEGLTLIRRIHELEAENERLKSERDLFESLGFARGRRRSIIASKIDMKRERVEALDVSPEQAPHG